MHTKLFYDVVRTLWSVSIAAVPIAVYYFQAID